MNIVTVSQNRTVMQNLTFGLQVWAEEMKWMFSGMGRCWEIRQLEKRLGEEHALLGARTSAMLDDKGDSSPEVTQEMSRAYGQVCFLKEEISRLRKEADEREQNRRSR